jgi:hypothetical protein
MGTSPPAIKHWRAFGAEEWRHVGEGVVGVVLGSLLPVLFFYAAFRAWGLTVAILIVLSWSAAVFAWHYRRAHGPDVFSATTFAFACTKAVAGLASQNAWLYLAWPSLENIIYGTAFVISALLGKPILALYAERLYPIPRSVRATETFRRAFIVVSLAWLVGHTMRAFVRLFLLSLTDTAAPWAAATTTVSTTPTLPLEWYLVLDTIVGWPINIALVTFTAWYPLREFRRAGFMDVTPVAINPLDAVELAVDETAPRTV